MNEALITFFASFLIWFMFGGLFIIWVVDGKIRKEQVAHALISSFLAWTAAELIKSIFPIARPFSINSLPALTLTIPGGGAFPSAHSAISFALAASIWLHNKRLGVFYLLAALAVGLGRIYGNVHYPLDILVGALLGSSIAFATEKLHLFKLISRIVKL